MADAYDVIIIGAGPAGLAAARVVATATENRLLVDGGKGIAQRDGTKRRIEVKIGGVQNAHTRENIHPIVDHNSLL